MKKWLFCLFLFAAARGFAAPEFVQNDARHASYARLLPDVREPAYADSGQRRVIQLLAERATPPVTPHDVVAEDQLSEIVFGLKPINRPATFGAAEFVDLWKTARLENAVGAMEISLAPDVGFIVLKDGQTLPVHLYGDRALRLHGFLFRKP